MKEHTDKTQVVQNVKRQIEKKTLTLEEKKSKDRENTQFEQQQPSFHQGAQVQKGSPRKESLHTQKRR